jgi:hypothetical protein
MRLYERNRVNNDKCVNNYIRVNNDKLVNNYIRVNNDKWVNNYIRVNNLTIFNIIMSLYIELITILYKV